MSTEKISHAQVAEVLADVPGVLRKLAEENKELREKVAAQELHSRCEKLAHAMHDKNIHSEVAFADLVEHLEKQASEGKLDAVEQAVGMVAPDMGMKLAQLTSDERGTSATSEFERFIVGGVG
jgi:aldehyde:ferredoxin oxidoreductase